MVGTAILATGLFSIWVSLATLSSYTMLDQHRSDARIALANQLDGVRSMPFDQIRIGTTQSSVSNPPNGELVQVVTAVTDDLRQVELTINWTTQTGSQQMTVATRVARGGISGN